MRYQAFHFRARFTRPDGSKTDLVFVTSNMEDARSYAGITAMRGGMKLDTVESVDGSAYQQCSESIPAKPEKDAT